MDDSRLSMVGPSDGTPIGPRLPLLVLLWLAGCPGNGPSSQDDSDESSGAEDNDGGEDDDEDESEDGDDDGGDNEYQACHEAFMRGASPLGGPCSRNEHCDSLVCETFETTVAPSSATCAPTPAGCRSRIMGTARDLLTDEPIPEAEIALIPAAEAAGGVLTAEPLLTTTADAAGQFDVVTDEAIRAFVAVIGLVTAQGYTNSTTGLAIPIDNDRNYEPCFGLREWWAVADEDLARWSIALEGDAEIEPHLPLDESWVVVGLMITMDYPVSRVAGATIVPADPQNSEAIVRYLNEDGETFNDQQTSSNGVFVMLDPGPGEQFDAQAPGRVPFRYEWVRAASFPDTVFAFAVHLVPAG